MTVFSRLSKACTTFLSEPNGAGAAALIVDVSQERTNLTNNATYASESSSARNAIDAPRSISVVVDMRSTDLRPLVELGAAGSYSYQVTSNAGLVLVNENNSPVTSVTVPGLIATFRKVLIHWAVRPAELGNVHELSVYNFVTGAWAYSTAAVVSFTPNAGHTLTIGASFGGASPYTGGLTAFHVVRIGRRFVTGTEAKEDFVEEATPPVMEGRNRSPLLTGISSELMIASAGEFAGPQYLLALAATRQADSRFMSPLVNVVHRDPAIEDNSFAPSRYYRRAPDDPEYRFCARYLWHAPVSMANRARCRVHVEAYNVGGPGDPICPLYFRVYSIEDFLSDVEANYNIQKWRHTGTHKPFDEPTGSPGIWVDLGSVKLLTNGARFTALTLAFSFNLDDGDILEGQTAFKVKAVTIEPYFDPGDGADNDDKAPGKLKF